MKHHFFAVLCFLQGVAAFVAAQSPAVVPAERCTKEQALELWNLFENQNDAKQALPYAIRFLELYPEPDTFDPKYAYYLSGLAMLHFNLGNNTEALKNIERERAFTVRTKGAETAEHLMVIKKLSVIYDRMEKLSVSEKYLMEALALCERLQMKREKIHADLLNIMGLLQRKYGNFELAESLYLQAIESYPKEDKDLRALGATYQNLAKLYETMNRAEQAEPYYLKALKISAEQDGETSNNYALILGNYAGLTRVLERHQEAEQLFLKTLSIYEKSGTTNNPTYGTLLNNLSILYSDMKKFELAEAYANKALLLIEKSTGKDNINYASGLQNLILISKKRGDHAQVESRYKACIELKERVLGPYHPSTLLTLDDRMWYYQKQNKMQDFERSIWLSLHRNTRGALDTLQAESQALRFFKEPDFVSNRFAINALLAMNDRYRYQLSLPQADSSTILNTNLELLRTGKTFAGQIHRSFLTEGDKLRSLGNLLSVAYYAIDINEQLFKKQADPKHVTEALAFMEQNKSTQLMQHIKTGAAAQFGNLPDSLMEKEKNLGKELEKLNKELAEAKGADALASLKIKKGELDQSIADFRTLLQSQYPKYFQFKYTDPGISAESIQQYLSKESALLEYFVSDNSDVFAVLVRHDRLHLQRLPVGSKTLAAMVDTLRVLLTDYERIRQQPQQALLDYAQAAFAVYQAVLQPLEQQLQGIGHLTIIPDGYLNFIPFEALLTEPVSPQTAGLKFSKLPYILHRYQVSYNYSAALFHENYARPVRQNNGKILGIAAHYPDSLPPVELGATRSAALNRLRNTLVDLPSAQDEVKTIKEQFQGTFWFEAQANESAFKKQASEYNILHLAMHGLLNQKNPILSALAFTENLDSTEDNFLQAYEISQMELNANLVILSACETGYGKFKQGEGVMSLARSFMYAGVAALVVSLWEINDASTADIMRVFYQNLSQGKTKSKALQLAKLDYLSGVRNDMGAHPAFWSALVELGDDRPITVYSKGGSVGLWLALGGAGLLSGLLVLRRLRRRG